MKIEINIQKKHLHTLIVLLALLGIMSSVWAVNLSRHAASEIDVKAGAAILTLQEVATALDLRLRNKSSYGDIPVENQTIGIGNVEILGLPDNAPRKKLQDIFCDLHTTYC